MNPGETLEDPGSATGATELEYAPGEQIAARYQVRALLGRGSRSAVYRVVDRTIDEEMAVKLIADPVGGVGRLSQETKLARRVTHRNVCRVFDLVQHRHGALLSMEYVAGGTLAERVGQPHPDGEVRELAVQILDGLGAAHDAGVIHRDLKPANILLGAGGRVVLSDFGIARPVAAVLDTADSSGTPAYMAPEQLRGEPTDPRTDLYALGLVLYELVVGRLPFVPAGEAVTMAATLRRLTDAIPAVAGSALAPAIAALLERDPARRPADVAAARALLAAEPAPRRRRRLVAAGAVALAAAALTTALLRRAGPATPVSPAAPRTRTLTGGDEGITEPPAFLPDGSALVFATNRSGSFQLWSVSAADALVHQLSRGPGDKHFPEVAGDQLYYLVDRADAGFDVWRVPLAALATPPVDGTAERVLERVARAHASARGDLVYVEVPSEPQSEARLTVVPANGGAARVIADRERGEILWAYFSPDGRRIAYVHAGPDAGSLWAVDAAGGAPWRVASGVLAAGGLAWAPDSAAIAFFRERAGARELVVADVDRATERVAIADLPRATCPSLSADGRLAYIDDQIDYDLWVLPAAGALRRITFLGDERAVSPNWASQRDELGYLVTRPDGPPELRLVDGATYGDFRARRRLPSMLPYVVLSPDGERVAYTERRGDRVLLLLGPARTTAGLSETVTESVWPTYDFPTFLAADGTLTFVHVDGGSGRTSIWEAGGGGDPRRLVDDAGGGFRSDDGAWIAFKLTAADQRPSTFIQAVAGGRLVGQPVEVASELPILSYRFRGASHELYALDQRELYAIDPLTGQRRHLADLPPGTLDPDRIAVDPDGRVAVALGVGRQSLVLVDNFADLVR